MVSFGLSSIYWVKYQNLGPYFTYFTKVIKIHNKGDIIFIIMMTLEMLIHFPCKVLIVSGDNNPQRQLKLLVLDKRVDLKVLPIQTCHDCFDTYCKGIYIALVLNLKPHCIFNYDTMNHSNDTMKDCKRMISG